MMIRNNYSGGKWNLHFLILPMLLVLTACGQGPPERTEPITIPVNDASKYIGKIVKLNSASYRTVDRANTLTIYLNTGHPAKPIILNLDGNSRTKLAEDMQACRQLNKQVKQPFDTSITATGKIISDKGQLKLVVDRFVDIYLGADAQLQKP